MQITGYYLREEIKRATIERDTAAAQFNDSLSMFPGETKLSPKSIMERFQAADRRLAELEVAQQRYNSLVTVNVEGVSMTLGLAVKLVGGAGRREKMWRDAALNKKDRYSYDSERRRSKDDIYATRTISVGEATDEAVRSGKYASALRTAIATGNNTALAFDTLNEDDLKLFVAVSANPAAVCTMKAP